MRKMVMGGLALAAMLGAGPALAADKVQIGDRNVFPESITTTADGTLIAGSLGTGQIYRAAAGATAATPWIAAPADGPASVTGVFADEPNKTLWACYTDLAVMTPKGGKGGIARSYDLATGALKSSVPLGDGTFCSDFATAADGTAYISELVGGQVFRVAPGATAAAPFFKDPALKGVDGISLGPDGALYLNSVTASKLFRLPLKADGSPGPLSELKLSQPIKGPDGMRFGDDGVLYLAENGAPRIDAITIDGDNANITVLKDGGLDMPTAVSKSGHTLWVGESQVSKLGSKQDAGPFWAYAIPLGQ